MTSTSSLVSQWSRVVRTAVPVLLLAILVAAPLPAQRTAGSPVPRRDLIRADDGHQLVVWSKRPRGRAIGSLLLLHGRTWSALPNFDLQVAGQRVSLMDAFTARGYAVYALDQRGHGATLRDSSQWLTPNRAARDAAIVLEWVAARERSASPPALFGYSQGARTAMLTAQRSAAALSSVILYGFPADVANKAPAASDPLQLARRRTTIAAAEEDFITPEFTPAGVKQAYGRAAVAADPVRTDWRGESEWQQLDPGALRVPVMLISGERDPYSAGANLPAFVARVRGVDRSLVVLANADHAAHLERQPEFADAVVAFAKRAVTPAPR